MKLFIQTGIAVVVLVFGTVFAYARGGINSGRPVPYIGDNETSALFLAKRFYRDTGIKQEVAIKFTRKLAKTLSQLSPEEQNQLWNGA